MKNSNINNLDEVVNNLVNELSQYFYGTNYSVHFIAKAIPLEHKSVSIETLLKPFVTTPEIREGTLKGYPCDGLNEKDFKRNGMMIINIQKAKSILNKLIIDEELRQDRKINKKNFERLDKLWQLISHYVSFQDSEIYFYDKFKGLGIFWSYSLLIIDKKSNWAFFLGAGAWD